MARRTSDDDESGSRQPESRVLADSAKAILGPFQQHGTEAHQCDGEEDDDRPEQQLQKEQTQIRSVVDSVVQAGIRPRISSCRIGSKVIPVGCGTVSPGSTVSLLNKG